MISFSEMKDKIKELGYYAEDSLVYNAYNALLLFDSKNVRPGQDIYAICLEGPPGAGKTEFAKIYTKIVNFVFSNVEMVEYQCDATTGKNELNEDVNMSAAIRHDADNVIIPGKLVTAINKVNEGKKVVLFLDEYDKAREETDAFLLQFLQDGKLNAVQCGDLEIKKEFKHNLQVILCKNDMREELSGPLSRRVRIIRLDYMKPNVLYDVAKRVLVDEREEPINDGLLNMVTLMYSETYKNKDVFNRLPSCSEVLIALDDADRLMKMASAPKNFIYSSIVTNLFKNQDDIATFDNIINKRGSNNTKLADLIKSMKSNDNQDDEVDINTLIASKVFNGLNKELEEKTLKMSDLITEYKKKFAALEEQKIKEIEEEKRKIELEGGKLVTVKKDNISTLFEDETKYVKRGFHVFDLASDWTSVGSLCIDNFSNSDFINNLIKNASSLKSFIIYEDGILIETGNNIKLVVALEKNNNQKGYYFYTSSHVLPSTYLKLIDVFKKLACASYISQVKDDKMSKTPVGKVMIDTLIYNDQSIFLEKIDDNVYHYINPDKDINSDILSKFEFKCENPEEALKFNADQKVKKKVNND